MALRGGEVRPDPFPRNKGSSSGLGAAPSWALKGPKAPTHPSTTKKKISGRSKGTSTRKVVL